MNITVKNKKRLTRLTMAGIVTGLSLLTFSAGSMAHPRAASAASGGLSSQDQATVQQLWPRNAPLVEVNGGEVKSVAFSNAAAVASLLANHSISSALRQVAEAIPVGERVSVSSAPAAAPNNAAALLGSMSASGISPNSSSATAQRPAATGGNWYTATGSCNAYTNGGGDSFNEHVTQLFYGDGHNVTNVQPAQETH